QVKLINKLEEQFAETRLEQMAAASQLREKLMGTFADLREELRIILSEHGNKSEQRQGESLKQILESLQSGMTNIQKQVGEHLGRYSEDLGKRMESLTDKTDKRLQDISGQVEKR
ncbi:MAG: DNA recombination protein RmuC, partial [Candidatus Aminicenantes bacterium]|nr:DNA recombination protein RmuC [Candidatus Aminicenantes bacterium]